MGYDILIGVAAFATLCLILCFFGVFGYYPKRVVQFPFFIATLLSCYALGVPLGYVPPEDKQKTKRKADKIVSQKLEDGSEGKRFKFWIMHHDKFGTSTPLDMMNRLSDNAINTFAPLRDKPAQNGQPRETTQEWQARRAGA